MRYLFCAILSLLSFGVSAEIYTWKDENGITHIEDRKPVGKPYHQVKVQSSSGVQIYRAPAASARLKPATTKSSKQVVMYGTTWCGYCTKARRYFQANNIPFQDWDIEASAAAKSEYDALNGKGVPLIVVGDQVMRGFSESAFNQFYAR
jgi:glutaredoxin